MGGTPVTGDVIQRDSFVLCSRGWRINPGREQDGQAPRSGEPVSTIERTLHQLASSMRKTKIYRKTVKT
jgi:hypothetical protein